MAEERNCRLVANAQIYSWCVKSNIGTIYSNDNDTLTVETSKSDYKAYVEECKFMGQKWLNFVFGLYLN